MRATAIVVSSLLFASCAGESDERLVCEECIALEPLSLVSFAGAPTYPDAGGRFAISLAGERLAFVAESTPYEVLVFDAAGQFERAVGTQGQGPGEFEEISLLAFDGTGALWVVSSAGVRLDIFGPELELESSERVPFRITHLAPVHGGMAASVATEDEGRVGLLSPSGEFQKLWERSSRGTEFPGGVSAFESDGRNRIWFAEEYEYGVWETDVTGNAHRRVKGTPGWFEAEFRPDVVEQLGGTRDATIVALDFDPDQELLWVVSGVPSQDLTGEELIRMYQDPELDSEAMYAAMIDHMVEAFDASSGTRQARGRLDLPRSAATSSPFRLSGPEALEVVRPVINAPGI